MKADCCPWFPLRPVQEEALALMESNFNGFYDVPCGAGKTAIGVVGAIRHGNNILVVCKTNESCHAFVHAFKNYTTFPNRIFHFSSESADSNRDIVEALSCRNEEGIVVVSNYSMLAAREGSDNGTTACVKAALTRVLWDVRVLDEAHCAPAATYRAFLERGKGGCASQFVRTIALTGTLVRDESLKARLLEQEKERKSIREAALPRVLSHSEVESALEKLYFERDFAWLGKIVLQKTWMEQEREGSIAKMHFCKVAVKLNEREKDVRSAARSDSKNTTTVGYVEELCWEAITAIEAIARLHLAAGDAIAIFTEHTAAAIILSEILGLDFMTADTKLAAKVDGSMKERIASSPQARMKLIQDVNAGTKKGFITTKIGYESLDIGNNETFRVGIRIGPCGRSSFGQAAGRISRTKPGLPQKHAFFYDIYTTDTSSIEQSNRRVSFAESQGYTISHSDGDFFINSARGIGWTPSYETEDEQKELLVRVYDVHSNAKKDQEVAKIRSQQGQIGRIQKHMKRDAVRRQNERLDAVPGVSADGKRKLKRYRKERLDKQVSRINVNTREATAEKTAEMEKLLSQKASESASSSVVAPLRVHSGMRIAYAHSEEEEEEEE